MTKGRLYACVDVMIVIFGITSFVCGMAFLGICAERGVYRLAGWPYRFESIGHYLNLTSAQQRTWSWDKTWLFAAVSAAAACLACWTNDIRTWANKTPLQRRAERQAELDRAAARKVALRERAALRKVNRKPMSGWRRLWLVLSVISGVCAFIIAWDANSRLLVSVPYDGNNVTFWERARSTPELQACDQRTMKALYPETNSWHVSCEVADPLTPALLWSLVPGLVMAAVGLTVRWVYRGFRPPTRTAPAE